MGQLFEDFWVSSLIRMVFKGPGYQQGGGRDGQRRGKELTLFGKPF